MRQKQKPAFQLAFVFVDDSVQTNCHRSFVTKKYFATKLGNYFILNKSLPHHLTVTV